MICHVQRIKIDEPLQEIEGVFNILIYFDV